MPSQGGDLVPPPQGERGEEVQERKSAGNLSASSSQAKLSSARTPTTEKKQKSWYYASMYPSYKTRKGEFKDQFPECHKSKFVVDYSCAYHKDILHQGRMFVTNTTCCFYSYIFGWEQRLILHWSDVTAITKEKTALFIPNAVQIVTNDNKFFFASFVDRESSFMMMLKFWQAATSEQFLSEEDIDQIIALNYGEGDDEEVEMEEDEDEDCVDFQVPPESWGTEEGGGGQQEELPSEVSSILNTWMAESGGSIVCDKTLERGCKELYHLLYTNSNFFFTFHKDQGSTELEIGEWELEPDQQGKEKEQRQGQGQVRENGEEQLQGKDLVREVSYNMSLSNPVGPKKCQVKETQKMGGKSVIEDEIYCIQTSAENSGVPYADSFTVVTNSCLVSLGPSRARFIAKAEITFKKDLWSFLKDKIEANAWSGITNYYAQLASSLESYSSTLPEHAQCRPGRQSGRAGSLGPQDRTLHGPQGVLRGPATYLNKDIVLYLLIILLMVTSALNTLALCRLSNLVDLSVDPGTDEQQQPFPPPPPPLKFEVKEPKNKEDWIVLLEQQAQFYSQRSAWLKQRLISATSYLTNAEVELGRLREELEGMEATDWTEQHSDIELLRQQTDCDKDSCDKDEQTMHVVNH